MKIKKSILTLSSIFLVLLQKNLLFSVVLLNTPPPTLPSKHIKTTDRNRQLQQRPSLSPHHLSLSPNRLTNPERPVINIGHHHFDTCKSH